MPFTDGATRMIMMPGRAGAPGPGPARRDRVHPSARRPGPRTISCSDDGSRSPARVPASGLCAGDYQQQAAPAAAADTNVTRIAEVTLRCAPILIFDERSRPSFVSILIKELYSDVFFQRNKMASSICGSPAYLDTFAGGGSIANNTERQFCPQPSQVRSL
jgi:hypothetical protein